MEQSDQVKEILDSKEFRAWLPEKRCYLELPRIAHFWAATFLSLGLGCAFTILLSTVILMIGYFAYAGYGETRILLADRETLEICTMNERFLHCRWEDILEVRKIKSGGYEVVSCDGSAKVWWSPLPIAKPHSIFFREVLRAMAEGVSASKLRSYRVPTELETGNKYIYKFKSNHRYLHLMLFGGFVLIPGTLYKIGHHASGNQYWPSIVILAGFLLLHFLSSLTSFSKSGDTVEVSEEEIIVTSKKKSIAFAFNRLESFLIPSLEPVPFQGAEIFGTKEKSVIIDRRFLEPVWVPKNKLD
jgi:hypothetical protein